MQRNRTRRRSTLGKRGVSRYLLRFRDQLKARSGQHRCMQHLANGASCLGSFSMLVQKREARGDV
jgi:hypothetical protein